MKHIISSFWMTFFVIFVITLTGCKDESMRGATDMDVKEIDLSSYSTEKPEKRLNLLFIHHSCGAALLANPGEKSGEYCLYSSHPNGGGLRSVLEENNYSVHEATYGSKVGEDTDINHWHAKFRDHMNTILRTDHQDRLYSDNSVNNIVVFKSCYPNNDIKADGTPPGDPDSPERTMASCKAAYNSLFELFRQQPDTLFVAVTPPPLAKPVLYKKEKMLEFLKTLVGRPDTVEKVGRRARAFNNWLKDTEAGWLSNYNLKNVVVFDYYDILTKDGGSNWAKYPTKQGRDSHPSGEGNAIASKEFVIFLNKAMRYAGLS